MRCANFLVFALSVLAVCLIQPQVLAQETSASEGKIVVQDAAADQAQPEEQQKLQSTNAEIGTPPKMSEVAKQPIYWMCRLKHDVRTIRIEAEKGTCTAKYSKEGNERVVGQSAGMRSCYQVFANIRRNLENAEYKCRDISTSRISSAN